MAYDQTSNDRIQLVSAPAVWGASGTTQTTPDGQHWTVPAGNAMRPVGDISWRVAAMYCNWLHNDKRTDRAAFLNGAYDVSTFGYLYDLNKVNLDGSTGGWWKYSITQPEYGPPGVNVNAIGFAGPNPGGPRAQANAA